MIRRGEAEGTGNCAQGGVSGSRGSCSGKFQGDGEAENGNPAPRPRRAPWEPRSLDTGLQGNGRGLGAGKKHLQDGSTHQASEVLAGRETVREE